ncbi:GGDEF domain-containing protein [Microbacterium sp. 4R-513]|uniref:GGDEF domain-containing protein n=1 Tax=Microbacterium sp. 4R-513 TaxID=2567934 RepID=UPI0013E1B818|nr:GGDEF domain-containing protein [Microbacterium sp. 4R-513]QIG40070.1 GGDEF domain-containing protein [Microbacterium sp. 4R-513]
MSEADALPVGLVHARQGIIADANAWFAEWAGTTPENVVGRSIDEFVVHAREDLLSKTDAAGPWVMLSRDAPERAVMMSRHCAGEADVLVLSEASERWRALSSLRRRYALADRTRARLELIMDSSVAFATATTEQRLAELLADATARAYGAEESTVYFHDADGSSVVAAGRDPFSGRFDPEVLIGRVSEPRRVVTAVGPAAADRLALGLGSAMETAGVEALIAAPLHHEEMDFGAFVSWFHHERTFDDEAAPLAEALAGQAAQALATLRLQARLAHAAMHDEVTGLPNRRMLEGELEKIVGSSGCAVLFIDLDEFKDVNDRLGHHAGDRILRQAAERLRASLRADDLVARYGGDEFVVACPVTDASTVREFAERILGALNGGPEDATALRASIGVAIASPESGMPGEHLIRQADLAMYRAKGAGGNQVE